MFQKKDFGNVEFEESLRPAVHAADVNGESVDTRGSDGVGVLLQTGVGVSLTAANYYRFRVQHSPDGTTWASVVAADMHSGNALVATVNAAADTNSIYKDAYIGGRRYVRIQADLQGTGATIGASAAIILSRVAYQ